MVSLHWSVTCNGSCASGRQDRSVPPENGRQCAEDVDHGSPGCTGEVEAGYRTSGSEVITPKAEGVAPTPRTADVQAGRLADARFSLGPTRKGKSVRVVGNVGKYVRLGVLAVRDGDEGEGNASRLCNPRTNAKVARSKGGGPEHE